MIDAWMVAVLVAGWCTFGYFMTRISEELPAPIAYAIAALWPIAIPVVILYIGIIILIDMMVRLYEREG